MNLDKPILNVRNVCSDNRGVILAVEYLGYEVFSLFATKKGYARGGHYHSYPALISIPIGEGKWFLKKPNEDVKTSIQKPGEQILIDANEIHYVVAEEDFLFVERSLDPNVLFNASNDVESRRIVDEINVFRSSLEPKEQSKITKENYREKIKNLSMDFVEEDGGKVDMDGKRGNRGFE